MAGELDGDLGGSDLAECHMVSPSPEDVSGFSPNSEQSVYSFRLSQDPMVIEELDVEAHHIQTIKRKFDNTDLTDESVLLLIDSALTNTPTNHIYQWGQHLFIAWALQQAVSLTEFILQDLINFLVYQHNEGFGMSTIKNHYTAALKLHTNPESLRFHEDVWTVFSCLALQASPLRQSRPSIDLAPTLNHVASIVSITSTSLAPLLRKTVFLIFIAIQSNFILALCPVLAFCALRDHPQASTAHPPECLFVNAHQSTNSVQVSIISSWLCSLLQLSMHEPVLVQSIASTLALKRDMSLDNIVTLGNWSSHKVFQQHYNRNHILSADFTNVVLRPLASILVLGLVVLTVVHSDLENIL
ncbi:hypothetical protein J3Q64DRAFT_1694698 [Phycomyces blakesleeanus]|uniref:Uncharacterized protein n=1 Tax=Phycomyces blakesleeanus TaxID=4837 RepID=A0ABR3BHN2_PHYBL